MNNSMRGLSFYRIGLSKQLRIRYSRDADGKSFIDQLQQQRRYFTISVNARSEILCLAKTYIVWWESAALRLINASYWLIDCSIRCGDPGWICITLADVVDDTSWSPDTFECIRSQDVTSRFSQVPLHCRWVSGQLDDFFVTVSCICALNLCLSGCLVVFSVFLPVCRVASLFTYVLKSSRNMSSNRNWVRFPNDNKLNHSIFHQRVSLSSLESLYFFHQALNDDGDTWRGTSVMHERDPSTKRFSHLETNFTWNAEHVHVSLNSWSNIYITLSEMPSSDYWIRRIRLLY